MNTAATEIENTPKPRRSTLAALNPYDPHPETQVCRCPVCRPEWYGRYVTLDKLSVVMEAWSNVLVDAENEYTDAGDDPVFDYLHVKLNNMLDEVTDEINLEDERIATLRGD